LVMRIFSPQGVLQQQKVLAARTLAHLAVTALVAEAELTPKPALVDRRGSGAHTDLTLALMKRSAQTLSGTFATIAFASMDHSPDQALREHLGEIGREGERAMLEVTHGVNTHRGAIWAMGLLVAGAAIAGLTAPARHITARAGELAHLPDRFAPDMPSHGLSMQKRYGVAGARGEAQRDFPCVIEWGLPTLRAVRQRGATETCARLDALLAIMTQLDDTCLLYRGGLDALCEARESARAVLRAGGTGTAAGLDQLSLLESSLLLRHASPGGSADLLAATLFLDALASGTPPAEGGREWNV
jgi:triphosphoribosyl-dephospho-CoA synthase